MNRAFNLCAIFNKLSRTSRFTQLGVPTMWSRTRALLAFAVLLAVAANAQATMIPIANYSFENPTLPNDYPSGTYFATGLTDWLTPGAPFNTVYTFNLGSAFYTNAAGSGTPLGADGTNIAIITDPQWGWYGGGYTGSGSNIVIQPGTYTLTVAVGQRLGGGASSVYYLMRTDAGDPINGGISGPSTYQSGNFLSSVPGAFQDFSYAVTFLPGDPSIGAHLGFGIFSNAPLPLGSGGFSDFDNVRLDFTPIPEPSSLALLALGGVFMWLFKGQRRR